MATGGTQYRQHVRHDKILVRVDAQELDQSSKICLPKLKILSLPGRASEVGRAVPLAKLMKLSCVASATTLHRAQRKWRLSDSAPGSTAVGAMAPENGMSAPLEYQLRW